MKTRLKKGDKVIIIAGKDKSTKNNPSEGTITHIDRKKGRVIVEGFNKGFKHIKPNAAGQGGRIEQELPIHISNVMYSYKGKPVRLGVEMKETDKGTRKVRVAIVNGERIAID
ncbi:MAG: 50S ribosomal protein L24 [Epulopiscium sp. Nuni2H_MBin003]|nr:MAG: 50S ribosomal protein L24 [Epulopiscium sp. Nuni2H_MBin003]